MEIYDTAGGHKEIFTKKCAWSESMRQRTQRSYEALDMAQ